MFRPIYWATIRSQVKTEEFMHIKSYSTLYMSNFQPEILVFSYYNCCLNFSRIINVRIILYSSCLLVKQENIASRFLGLKYKALV